MTKLERVRNYTLQYVIYTYGLFVLLLITLGGAATTLLHGTPLVMRWLTAITAWTSTYVFLLMFRKLYPDSTVKEFYKKMFRPRISMRLLMATTSIQMLIFVSSLYMVSTRKGVSMAGMLDLSSTTVLSALFFTLIQGATGEETGWRGHVLPVVGQTYGETRSSLIVSVLWSFWHAPICFVGTGYHGSALLQYIIAFIICIVSLGYCMSICFYRCRNLLVPIWMHFTFNFLGELFEGPMVELVTWYAVFYFLVAAGTFALNARTRQRSVQGGVSGYS